MKIQFLQKITILIITCCFTFSCVHDDDYNAPFYPNGETLTATTDIASLKEIATVAAQKLDKGIVEGYVVSSDNGGNIYKSLYIVSEDGKTGLQISINQANLYNMFPVGRKVYINLEGLAIVLQHNAPTIGVFPKGKYPIDQIDSRLLKKHIILGTEQKNVEELEKLVIKTNSSGQPLTINNVRNDRYLNTLVELSDVEFIESGTSFVIDNSNTDNGINYTSTKIFTVRVSNYASFGGIKKPFGKGKLRGILTKYNTTYQLLIRDTPDIKFPSYSPIFLETFNNTTVNGRKIVSSPWPKIKEIADFDNTAVSYSDPYNTADIRKTALFSLGAWLPAAKDASLVLNNINTKGQSHLILSFRLNANIFNDTDTAFVDDLILKCNNVEISLPHTELNASNNKNTYYTVEVPIPDNTTQIEFYGSASKNKTGLRIDDIQINN